MLLALWLTPPVPPADGMLRRELPNIVELDVHHNDLRPAGTKAISTALAGAAVSIEVVVFSTPFLPLARIPIRQSDPPVSALNLTRAGLGLEGALLLAGGCQSGLN
eukprot:SAG11_NODE_5136_length_1655_cov_1.277635_2_plen_106_part_00